MTDPTPDFTLPARTTEVSALFGKCSAEVKTKVPDEVKMDLERLAHSLGVDTSRVLRDLVMNRLYGADVLRRLADEQMRKVLGLGPENTTTGA